MEIKLTNNKNNGKVTLDFVVSPIEKNRLDEICEIEQHDNKTVYHFLDFFNYEISDGEKVLTKGKANYLEMEYSDVYMKFPYKSINFSTI